MANPEIVLPPARIEIGLVHGGIDDDDISEIVSSGGDPVDAIVVGHYVGVKPQAAELAVDRAISRALTGVAAGEAGADGGLEDGLLTQLSERGTFRGELGQPFLLADPRTRNRARGKANGVERTIVVAGMGVPARFGEPELTVLVRELCWALAHLGKRHLATVLIGSGNGNLRSEECISGWIRGIKRAVSGLEHDTGKQIRRVTFVEFNAAKIGQIHEAILREKRQLDSTSRLVIDYAGPDPETLTRLRQQGVRESIERLQRKLDAGEDERYPASLIPTRVTVAYERRVYRYGAITADASVPQREIRLDPALVADANRELAAEGGRELQRERARFMERLVIPEDLRRHLLSRAPLVLLLDTTTARLHWEMVAQPSLDGLVDEGSTVSPPNSFFPDAFLGTSRGLTRQLLTAFAPPPQPPPPPRRLLRVLVVADPAEDAPLPGASDEGRRVAELLESCNTLFAERGSGVEVDALIGPREATRTNVLRRLMLRSYDVLHFAGHCVYKPRDPAASGWVFSGHQLLSALELTRVDRVPEFVFSNACESGITPDRAEARSIGLAPSFAESFFARGVANFVCTAWPVTDTGALTFALELYQRLLGLEPDGNDYRASTPSVMHEAMRDARCATASVPDGIQTWGAYQHYGNPYFRLFEPARKP
jgi:CHAT domain